jgi:hypothetical protein
MLHFIIQITALILIADFLTGIVHWWEDSYGNPEWKILGKAVILPNLRHHRFPREFLKNSYFSRVNTALALLAVLAVILIILGWFHWQMLFVLLLASQGPEVHAMAHKSKKENGKFITWLQSLGILQTIKHHGQHHLSPFHIRYCVITNYVNLVLDKIKFWLGLEWVILKLFGIPVLRGSEKREI